MSSFTAINLSKLPFPNIVEKLSFENIYELLLEDFQQRYLGFNALVESDPALKLLQANAYRELLTRQRVNDAARSVMLAYAKAEDLDNLGALFGVERQIIDEGNPEANPPVPPSKEDDERFRFRIQLSLEGLNTAGSRGSYVFHTLNASPQVKDVDVQCGNPGEVEVTILSTQGNGMPDEDLLETVTEYLSNEDVRPLTDKVKIVKETVILPYRIEAELVFYDGPDRSVVGKESINALMSYIAEHHRLGHDITVSGLYAALHQPGVQNVDLHIVSEHYTAGDDRLLVEPNQAAYAKIKPDVGQQDDIIDVAVTFRSKTDE